MKLPYVFDEVRYRYRGLEADQNVNMVGHSVYGNQLWACGAYCAANVFEQFFFEGRVYQRLSAVYREDHLNIDLGVSVRHLWDLLLLVIYHTMLRQS